jgi:hypothetical protein
MNTPALAAILLVSATLQTDAIDCPPRKFGGPIPVVLAKRGRLLVDDDGTEDRGGKSVVRFASRASLRASAGA